MTCNRMIEFIIQVDLERLVIKRENDGKGLIQLELVYKTTIMRLKKY